MIQGLVLILLLAAPGNGEEIASEGPDALEVAPSQLDKYWRVRHEHQHLYPGYERQRRTEGCVRMGYIIETNGKVGFVEVLFSVPPGTFESAATGAMSAFRFDAVTDPGPDRPIYSTHTMTFFPDESPQTLDDLADLCAPPILDNSDDDDDDVESPNSLDDAEMDLESAEPVAEGPANFDG